MENKLKIRDGKINFRCKSDLCQHTCCGSFAGISSELTNVDNWIEIAERMITHENCIGTIFFNSLNSYISNPVAEERQLSLNKKKEWKKTANIDIFSCSFLDDGIVESILEQSFGEDLQINLVARGSKHKHNIRYLEKYNSNLETQKLWKQNI